MVAVAPVPVSDGIRAWLAVGAERVVETSIAWVFLYPDRALKLKKAVDFGFLDFTSIDQRRWATERELALNRQTAPDIYRAVHPVVRRPDGALALGGEGEVLDWVLEMRRFPDDAVLAEQVDRIDGSLGEALGREIARFHARAERIDRKGREVVRYVLDSNAHLLRSQSGRLGGAVERVMAGSEAEFGRLAPLLDRRGAAGFVRRCHGDLHLANLLMEQPGRPVLFDCIEFNDELSHIDVLYDFAFLLMDLRFRGCAEAANRALNGWLDEAARSFPASGFWDGLALLPLFQSMRAAIRAHVTIHQDEAETARAYLAAAEAHLAEGPSPRLVAVGGRSGSGKSTRSRAIAPGLGPAPGAVVLRSDEVRKRIFGVGPMDRLPPDHYTPEASARTYAALYDEARACLAAGWTVVLDAAFLHPGERADAEGLAASAGVPFEGIWMDTPPDELRRRVAARRDDASDADVAVLERQLGQDVGDIGWPRG
jgi:aminoglycoside phosphotransferase family enzyme/predicted kinase